MFVTFAGFVLVFLTARFIYNAFFHPLASYPGPLVYSGSELPRLIQEWRGNTVHKWSELHERYGPVVRIAPGQLSYISLQAWKDIYGARTRSMLTPAESSASHPMISCDDVNHGRHRRAIAPAFSERALRSYDATLMSHVNALMARLEQARASKGHINLVDWFNFTTFDITSTLVFGKSFGCLQSGKYHPWVARVFPGMKLIARSLVVAMIPGLGRLVSWFIPKALVREARSHMNNIVHMVEARRAMAPAQHDFMSYILPNINQSQEKDAWLTTEELYLNSQLLVIAGSETIATLLSGAIFLLAQNPEVNATLVGVLRSTFDAVDEMTPASTSCVAFLNAVINEALRIYPPGAINMPRTVPPGGAFVDGRFLPGGTVVGIAQFAAYRSPSYFEEPLRFAPERWIDQEGGGQYAGDCREVFKPFSYGPRNCIGQNLALVELRLILARLLWQFDVSVLPGQDTWIRQRTFLSWEKPKLVCRLD
ncbi:cytochrome P450 [Thozetella sp. PMI_491]|nr:cytochrome P450 [Thozetella sp. PMI_491]